MQHGFASRFLGDLRAYWRTALGFHFVMQLLGVAFFTPLATWLGRQLVLASGEPVVSNYDIAAYVLSPAGALFVLLAVVVTVGLLFAGLAGQTWVAGHAIARRPVTVAGTVAFVLGALPRLALLALRVFLRLALYALPLFGAVAAIWFGSLGEHDINFYLAQDPPEWRRAKLVVLLLVAAYAAVAAWQLARWMYAIALLAFEQAAPAAALERSAALTRGRLAGIVLPLLAWWIALTALAFAATWVCRVASDAGLDWAGIDVRRVLPLVALYLAVAAVGAFLYGGLGLAGQQFLVTRLYVEQRDSRMPLELPGEPRQDARRRRAGRGTAIAAAGLAVLVMAVGAVLWQRLDLHQEVAITAHRGASAVAPENSMAAFRAALDAGADYAELDVQRLADGTLVVAHDADFMRLAGDPRKVAQLVAADLATIDIGRDHEPAFPGEHPPTLDEVIALVRGRMKLNIELKYNVADPGLAPAVVELLRRERFLDDAVITSLDYAALGQVKALEPRLRTGHIVTAAVGDVLASSADFLSLNAARVSASLVRRAHESGKEIHVWTLNEPEGMLRMVERGVDNIITDAPALLARVMHDRAALSTSEILGLRLRVLFADPPPQLTDPAAVEPL